MDDCPPSPPGESSEVVQTRQHKYPKLFTNSAKTSTCLTQRASNLLQLVSAINSVLKVDFRLGGLCHNAVHQYYVLHCLLCNYEPMLQFQQNVYKKAEYCGSKLCPLKV